MPRRPLQAFSIRSQTGDVQILAFKTTQGRLAILNTPDYGISPADANRLAEWLLDTFPEDE